MYPLATSAAEPSKPMFATVALWALLVLALLVVAHLILRMLDKTPREERGRYRWGIFEKLTYFGFFVSVCILAATSLVSILTFGGMHGWWLVVHLMGAGTFVLLVAVMSWTVSFRFAFIGSAAQPDVNTTTRGFPFSAKVIYWLILILSLVVVGVILLGMFPLFGTDDLLQLIDVHRYSGLALFVAVTLHFLLVTRRPRRD